MDFDKKYIAQILQNARKRKHLKQSELAEIIGISEKHLSKIETGKNYPSLDNFLKIIEVLGLSLKDFGLKDTNICSENKEQLLKIINTSTEAQLRLYIDMVNMLQKHFWQQISPRFLRYFILALENTQSMYAAEKKAYVDGIMPYLYKRDKALKIKAIEK